MSKDKNIEISLEKLLEIVPNRFELSIVIAKRSKQLKMGSKPLIDVDVEKMDPIDIAIKEIYEGKIDIVQKDKVQYEESVLEELDTQLEERLKEELEEEEKEPKKKEPKSSKKSKSLAA